MIVKLGDKLISTTDYRGLLQHEVYRVFEVDGELVIRNEFGTWVDAQALVDSEVLSDGSEFN